MCNPLRVYWVSCINYWCILRDLFRWYYSDNPARLRRADRAPCAYGAQAPAAVTVGPHRPPNTMENIVYGVHAQRHTLIALVHHIWLYLTIFLTFFGHIFAQIKILSCLVCTLVSSSRKDRGNFWTKLPTIFKLCHRLLVKFSRQSFPAKTFLLDFGNIIGSDRTTPLQPIEKILDQTRPALSMLIYFFAEICHD